MWVARDKDGGLTLYIDKPHRCNAPGWNHESWGVRFSDNWVELVRKN